MFGNKTQGVGRVYHSSQRLEDTIGIISNNVFLINYLGGVFIKARVNFTASDRLKSLRKRDLSTTVYGYKERGLTSLGDVSIK